MPKSFRLSKRYQQRILLISLKMHPKKFNIKEILMEAVDVGDVAKWRQKLI